MKEFCNNILRNKPVKQNEVFTFVDEYLILKNKKATEEEFKIIIALLQQGLFNINYIIREYCREKGYILNILSKDNIIIKTWIDE